MQDLQRILIIKPSSLGDVIHTLPVLHALRVKFPKAHLAWFIHEKWADIVRGHPDLDEMIPWSFRWGDLTDLFKMFRHKRFDLSVDLQGLFRSGFVSYLSGAPVRVGFRNGKEGSSLFYTHKVDVPSYPIHAVDRYLLMAEGLGAICHEPVFNIGLTWQDERAVDDLLMEGGILPSDRFIAMNPTARWLTKRWPMGRFMRLADQIQEMGIPVVLIGGREDLPEVERMRSQMRIKPVSVVGQTTLKQLSVLLKKAKLLVTNDSGPMHLAVAVGTPVVALFGPTDPVRTGPYGYSSPSIMHTVIRKPVECSPCLSRSCRIGDHRCMMQIEVEEVFEVVKKCVNR